MLKNKRLVNETTTVDRTTGEIVTTSKTFNIKVVGEEFYMTFVPNMASFYEIKSLVDSKVLAKFGEYATFITGEVLLPPSKRAKIASDLKISVQQVTNSILNLKKLGLISGSRGAYELNPFVWWKGTTEARNNLLKNHSLELTVKFSKTKNQSCNDFETCEDND